MRVSAIVTRAISLERMRFISGSCLASATVRARLLYGVWTGDIGGAAPDLDKGQVAPAEHLGAPGPVLQASQPQRHVPSGSGYSVAEATPDEASARHGSLPGRTPRASADLTHRRIGRSRRCVAAAPPGTGGGDDKRTGACLASLDLPIVSVKFPRLRSPGFPVPVAKGASRASLDL